MLHPLSCPLLNVFLPTVGLAGGGGGGLLLMLCVGLMYASVCVICSVGLIIDYNRLVASFFTDLLLTILIWQLMIIGKDDT